MARTKNKVRRVTLYLNQAQSDALNALMASHMADTPSAYLGRLIADTWNTRNKPAGRPKKSVTDRSGDETEEEEPRDIPHPDTFMNAGKFMTQSEYDAWLERHPDHRP